MEFLKTDFVSYLSQDSPHMNLFNWIDEWKIRYCWTSIMCQVLNFRWCIYNSEQNTNKIQNGALWTKHKNTCLHLCYIEVDKESQSKNN